MLQLRERETMVCAPARVIFDRRSSDMYQIEKNAHVLPLLPVQELVAPTAFVGEQREPDAYQLEESALLATPFLLETVAAAAMPTFQEREKTAEQETEAPAIEPDPVSIFQETTQVTFRQATLEVDDPGDFWDGVVGGQVAAVEAQGPLTGAQIFELFEDAVRDVEFSETWLAGYLLGLSDALLRRRKTYPREYTSVLKPLKYHIGRRRKR